MRAFEMLGAGVARLPTTDDPGADLVTAGTSVFRPFAIQHPALFSIAMQHAPRWPEKPGEVVDAAGGQALGILVARVGRLQDAGPHTVTTATCAFHALCEGLAATELRGGTPPGQGERLWREALGSPGEPWGALVAGFAAAPAWTDRTVTRRSEGTAAVVDAAVDLA